MGSTISQSLMPISSPGAEALILQPSGFILSHKAYIIPNTLSLVYTIPRVKTESCAPSSSKACRKKQRRDKLNDNIIYCFFPLMDVPLIIFASDTCLDLLRFVEMGVLLEPGRPPKTDKAALLVDAVRMVTQLRVEAENLKDSNLNLQEKIKELKAEKNELRDEKQKLMAEKEKLEQQMKAVSTPQLHFFHAPPAISPTFAAQSQAAGNKLVPIIRHPGVAMCSSCHLLLLILHRTICFAHQLPKLVTKSCDVIV